MVDRLAFYACVRTDEETGPNWQGSVMNWHSQALDGIGRRIDAQFVEVPCRQLAARRASSSGRGKLNQLPVAQVPQEVVREEQPQVGRGHVTSRYLRLWKMWPC